MNSKQIYLIKRKIWELEKYLLELKVEKHEALGKNQNIIWFVNSISHGTIKNQVEYLDKRIISVEEEIKVYAEGLSNEP